MKKQSILLLTFSLLCITLLGQEIQVSGKVTSAADKTALPGVTVMVKGTTTGVVTSVDGTYSIQAPSDARLVFSFIGMQKAEIQVNGRKVINVELAEARTDLGEVVVLGYSTDSKKLITGSFGLVSENDIKNVPIRTVDGVLQGQTAGLSVFMNSGTPGGQTSIKLRGGSSINAGTTPLKIGRAHV